MVLLNTLTASGSANLQDTTSLTSSFGNYELIFQNLVPVTAATQFQCLEQNGGTFQTTGYLSQILISATAVANSLPTTAWFSTENTVGNNSFAGVSGRITIHGPVSTSGNSKYAEGQFAFENATAQEINMVAGFYNGSTGPATGFQCKFSSGNIASGVIKIYGIQ
jgi:hypothetical protein